MRTNQKLQIPHVTFRYSPIYDEQWRAAFDLLPKHERPYPDVKTTMVFMHRLEKEWRKNEQNTFKAIQKYSGIRWTIKEHLCYVVGSGDPFSDPLTMPVFAPQAPIDYVSDVLCHELIHRNMIEPAFAIRWKRIFGKLQQKYPKDNENVLVHVVVHAIHDQIFKNIFSEDRLLREKRIMSVHPDYRRAWEIVDSIGAENFIKKYLHSGSGNK
ncbi:MAG: hypothetical protein Q7N87_00230 [Candidatus Uhrbacteria bacterium]|nr:hypothetical protein [Candidatus Uhrbacteria bacterium]MDP3793608.1 hypothetical protein [Candidatus Uhrbacteria bacterium]